MNKKKILLITLLLLVPILINSVHATHEIVSIANYTEGNTTGTAWINHTVFDFEIVEQGEHLIIFTSEFTSGATNTVSSVRYVFDNETIGELVQQPKNLVHYYSATTTKVLNVTNGNHTILVQQSGGTAGTTTKVRNVKIQILMPSIIMHENTTLSQSLNTSWKDITNLNFVANQTGNYSIFITSEINATTTLTSRMRILVNGTQKQQMNFTSNDNDDYKGLIYHEAYLLSENESLNLTVQASTETPNSQARRTRINVFKHLDGVLLDQSETTFDGTLTSYVIISNITLVPTRTGLNSIIVTAELNSTGVSTHFDIVTDVNGTPICNFIGSPKTSGDVYNYGCLDSINVTDASTTYEISTRLKKFGAGTVRAKNVRMLVSQFFIALIDTELNLTFDEFFAIDENNLVQANYTFLFEKTPVENATCEFTSTTGNGTMSYNASSLQYEIFVIPDESDVGIIEFSVNCSKEDVETQIQDQQYFSGVFAGNPYNISIHLWETLNATVPYLDEFSSIMIQGLDYNCTVITGYEACWRTSEYNNGEAQFNDTVGIGNFSIWYYSGSVTQSCNLCPPTLETLNTAKYLGTFVFTESRTRLDLWIDVVELDFGKAMLRFVGTWGLMIIGFIAAILITTFIYLITGSLSGAVLSFIITVLILSYMGIIPNIQVLIGLLL